MTWLRLTQPGEGVLVFNAEHVEVITDPDDGTHGATVHLRGYGGDKGFTVNETPDQILVSLGVRPIMPTGGAS